MGQNKDREIAHQLLLWAEWAELRESNLILNIWLLIGKRMTSTETLKESTFHPLCQAQVQHRHPCPSLAVAVVGISFCCSLFLTLPLLLSPQSFPGLCWAPTRCSPSGCVTSSVVSRIHSPLTAIAVLPWKRLRLLWLFQGHHRLLLLAQLWPMEGLERLVQGSPSPLPLSPCRPLHWDACWKSLCFSGWFPCLSPAVFVFDGTDCFNLQILSVFLWQVHWPWGLQQVGKAHSSPGLLSSTCWIWREETLFKCVSHHILCC